MSCRFPGGAHDPQAFWQLLRAGVDAVCEIPPARWDARAHYDPDPETQGKMYTQHGGFLQADVAQFDPQFFGVSPREAESMDPQQRFFLEVSWEALEDAGLSPMARGFYAENRRVANGKAKRVLGWKPLYPDYKAGLKSLL